MYADIQIQSFYLVRVQISLAQKPLLSCFCQAELNCANLRGRIPPVHIADERVEKFNLRYIAIVSSHNMA